jgi:hypothetical protein
MSSSSRSIHVVGNAGALLVLVVSVTACATGTGETAVSTVAPQTSPTTASSPISTAGSTIVLPATATPTTVGNAGPCGQPGSAPPTYDHVIWIWMENKDSNEVFDSQHAPFMNRLAEMCGAASNYVDHGIHPSLPNYIAATSGGTQGVADDGFPQAHPLRPDNIFRQVRAIGKVSKSYEEAMPGNCTLQSTDRYAVKHNPAAYFVDGDDRTACERDNVPFDQFASDLANGLPEFSLITPDICNDMHDCSVAIDDAWLQDVVTSITDSATYHGGRTAIFIVFDESEGAGTMPFIAIAPSIKPGTHVVVELDHFALLAFTENALGIATHLGQAANATSIAGAFGL